MSKNIKRMIFAIPFAIFFGLMFNYFGYQVTLLSILVMIYIELVIGSDEE